MATSPSLRKRINALIDEMEPLLARAFLQSIEGIKSSLSLKRIVEALERRDTAAAIQAMGLDRPAFAPLENAMAQAYASGGATTSAALQTLFERAGAEVIFRFDVRNLRAERWLKDFSSKEITGIILPDQRASIRAAIEAGYAQGQGPRTIALDVVGRVDPETGRRVGGLIGLTEQQSEFSAAARAELRSGDTTQLRNYLGRTRRDARFDSHVARSLSSGEPIPADIVERMTSRYEARLLELRGEMISRTETMQAVHASKNEAFRQGLDATGYSERDVTRTWRSAGDGRVRDTHAAMNGQTVHGLETPFTSPSGASLRYPGDASLGAGPSEIIGCRST